MNIYVEMSVMSDWLARVGSWAHELRLDVAESPGSVTEYDPEGFQGWGSKDGSEAEAFLPQIYESHK